MINFCFNSSEIVIYQPPRLQVKLEAVENVYSGSASTDKIKSFIQSEVHGICGHRTSGNAKEFKKPLVVVYYNVDFVKDVKGSNYVRNRVIKVAQKLKGEGLKVNFAISSVEEFRQELGEYGIEHPLPETKYILGRGPNDQKYRFIGDYS